MGELKKYREFTVTPGICGFKVRIGCTEAYFGDARSLCDAIVKYLNDPMNTEEEYGKNDLRYGGVECARPTGPQPNAPSDRNLNQAEAAAQTQRAGAFGFMGFPAPPGAGGRS